MENKIICGSSESILMKLESNSIDLTVTSPPYDNLRDYNGYSFDFEHIAEELWRVTKPGGVVVWVVGDATINGSETGTSFKQALHFKEIGFNLYDTMIYSKDAPPLTHRRYEQAFEYMFVLSKGIPKTFNPILEKKLNMEKSRTEKGYQRNPDNKHKIGRLNNFKETKIIKNIWHFGTGLNGDTTDKTKFQHPAVFPDKLAAQHILSWSNEGDIVLDPFNGSGTTTKMAYKLNRKYIGIDISQEYCDIAEKRLMQQVLL